MKDRTKKIFNDPLKSIMLSAIFALMISCAHNSHLSNDCGNELNTASPKICESPPLNQTDGDFSSRR